MMTILAAAAIAAATPPALPAENADPAIFLVRDQDTTVYIFGTFHALDGKADWFNDQVKAAFDQSGELVLETLVPEGPAPIAFHNVPGPKFAAPSVTPSASFLATTRMAISAGKSQGMNVGNGADMVLRRAAELAGKKVEGLETLESQFAMFNRLPAPPRAAAPRPGSPVEMDGQMQNLSRAMADMQNAWKRGDQNVFAQMLGQLQRSSPDTYRMMFTERNARWADWIAGRMQYPGTVFVAVGAGHLSGKDSLLVRLAEQGLPSTRVN
ncbi:MAG TPA: TraB/GumN family protein [Sphingomicrobium sp.]